MEIKLLDIKRQYESIKQEVEKNVIEVLSSGQYIMGKNVERLEQTFSEYIGVEYAISVANGTDALVLALTALGVKEGDEVITSPFTFFSTAESISRVGATPVFVDIEENTFNMNAKLIEEKITSKTKAIIPVHIFGYPCDMDIINKIAKKYNLFVVEDACQAIGAIYKGKKVGSISDIACFSFFPTKNLGCAGDGGMVTTKNNIIAEKIMALRNHGSGEIGRKVANCINMGQDNKILEGYEKYYHYLIGYNSRLDEIQAAILNVKIKYLDEWNEKRREIAKEYNKKLYMYHPTKVDTDIKPVYHMYVLKMKDRNKVINRLKSCGITCGVYYPVPLHMQNVYSNLQYKYGELPIAEKVSNLVIALPIFPELTKEEQDYIIKHVIEE